MPAEQPDSSHWERVAAELRAAREAQQRTWGDLDNDVIGRYLANEATSSERQEVEKALDRLPELRLLTELVRDVLTETAPLPVPAAPARRVPATVPFRRPLSFTSRSPWLSRQRVGMLVAASLFLGLGVWLFRPFAGNPSNSDTMVAMSNGLATNSAVDRRGNHGGTDLSPADLFRAPLDVNDEKALAHANQIWEVAKKYPDLEQDPQIAPHMAARFNEVGDIFQNQGDLDRAEKALVKANRINRKTVGETHEMTMQTCCKLAGVYEVALASPLPEKLLRTASPSPPGDPKQLKIKPAAVMAARPNPAALAAFRERMSRPETRKQMREVLVKALHNSTSSGDRTRLAVALGNLGSTANDAAPDLIEVLQQAKEQPERFALIRALVRIGPNAAARKQLDELAENGPKEEQAYIRELRQGPRGGR